MESRDLIIQAFEHSFALVFPLLQDLATAPHVTPSPSGGNHAHFILGHLLQSEGFFRSVMEGTGNSHGGLSQSFGGGAQPEPTGNGYPPYADMLSELERVHRQTVDWLKSINETQLDQTSRAVPPGFEAFFGTWRLCLLMRPLHWMNHRGQLADCRRAAGRPPLMA